MRKNYLKEYRSGIYQAMVLSGTLKEHLLLIQEQAEVKLDMLVEQMAEKSALFLYFVISNYELKFGLNT